MTLTEVELATLQIALTALENDPDAKLPTTTINAIIGAEWAAEIVNRRKSFIEANKAAASGTGLLSGSAQDYWREARSVLSYGRLALSMGSRKAEVTLSRKCEALDESFLQRVPLSEQGFFLIHDIDGGNWDDRWHCCVDFYFPILRPELVGRTIMANPSRDALLEVLTEILRPALGGAPSLAEADKLRQAGKKVRDLLDRLNR